MSPEQAQGKPLDKRTDIWSFGVVLYQMLTGRKLFHGETVAETLASVLKESPDFARVPPHFVPLLRKCLEKDRKRRLQDIGDAMLLLEAAQAPPVRHGKSWLWPSVAAAFALATLVLASLYFRPKSAPLEQVTRFDIALPAGVNLLGSPVVSPNGSEIAVVGLSRVGAAPQIWIRSLDAVELQPLSGTEGVTGASVIWSPDSRYLAFSVGNSLRRIAASGGPTQKVCDTPVGLTGGVWTQDGKIVFGTESPGGLIQCSEAGGAASPPITGGYDNGPSLLPDGRHFIYVHFDSSTTVGEVYMGSIDGRPEQDHAKRLLRDVSRVAYVTGENGTGYLLFLRSDTLMAQVFDSKRMEMEGEAAPIPEPSSALITGFSASSTGVLVYRTGRVPLAQLSWFDRRGKPLGTVGDANTTGGPAISHDGKRVAYQRTEPQSGNPAIWIYDFTRNVPTHFTSAAGAPVWSPDDSQMAFGRGGRDIYVKASDGSGSERVVLSKKSGGGATSWSRDGRFLLYQTITDPQKLMDLWVLLMTGSKDERKTWPFLDSEAIERGARFSPDGHFVSYVSTESGQAEVYVRPFDASARSASTGPHWPISSHGGDGVHWSADGKELLYMAPDRTIMSVRVTTSPVFHAAAPESLFRSSSVAQFWDIAPDAQRFLIPIPAGETSVPPIKVVLNWSELLRH
jgi:Tol biopolymer transport system component